MKKTVIILLTAFVFIVSTKAQYVNIPDTSFGKFLLAQYPACLYKDVAANKYYMDTTCSGVVSEDSIIISPSFLYAGNMYFDGVEYFKNLKYFNAPYIPLLPKFNSQIRHLTTEFFGDTSSHAFDQLNDSLKILEIKHNYLTKIVKIPYLLEKLVIITGSLNELPNVLPQNLKYLNLTGNNFTTCPQFPSKLDSLSIGQNINLLCLSKLPDSLKYLDLSGAILTKINCLPNMPSGLSTILSFTTLSVCNTVNNTYNCPSPYVNIPDTSFGKFLLAQYPSCLYKDGSNMYWMDTTCSGVVGEDSLVYYGWPLAATDKITNISGLQYFTNLSYLSLQNHLFANANYLPANLKYVDVGHNSNLTSLSATLPNQLEYLSCYGNSLSTLPALPNTLKELYVPLNHLSNLPTLPNSLLKISVLNNPLITTIPALPIGLLELNAASTNLTALPSLPNTLQKLHLEFSGQYQLPQLSTDLQELDCRGLGLTGMPTLPNGLKSLDCRLNNIGGGAFVNIPDSLTNLLIAPGNSGLQCLPRITNPNMFLLIDTNIIKCVYRNVPNNIIIEQYDATNGGSVVINNFTNCFDNNPTNCLLPNYVNIPDTNFGKFLLAQYPSCLYKDVTANKYYMDTTCATTITNTTINCDNQNIHSIYGLQYFTNINQLSCNFNHIDSLFSNYLPHNLQYLFAESNSMRYIDSFPGNMQVGILSNNNLTSIPTLPISCTSIYLYNNLLTTLNIPTYSNASLIVAAKNNLQSVTSLPGNTVLQLFLDDNLNLQCLPKLPQGTVALGINNTTITCLPNIPNGLTTSLPICNATNNPNNCPSLNYVNIPDTNFGKSLLFKFPICVYKDASNKYWMDTTCSTVVNKDSLDCSHSFINNLEGVQYFKNLHYLNVFSNYIQSLPSLPNNLVSLDCGMNTIFTLTNLPSTLQSLSLAFTPLTTLPNLPNGLKSLYCYQSQLFSLPILPDSLIELNVANNNFLTCLPKLPANLKTLVCGNNITCLPNIPSGLTTTLPICSPSNNANHCLSFPVVYGKVFTDNNSNGIKDTNEFYRPFVKVTLNTGEVAYTNQYGAYAITTDSIGDYTLKTTAPPYFKAVPDSNNFTFTQYQTTLTLADIALQPLVAKDSFAIAATAFTNRPRPGFNYTYNVAYGNAGTVSSTTNNIVSFTFDSSRLIFDSASVPLQSIVGGNQILVNAGALVAGQGGVFNLYFTVKTTAVIGDSVKALATIDFSGTQSYSYYVATIIGSYDPNDKQATPELSPTQVANGEYIDYTIRFQNVGNAAATNIVIADTLSNLLQQYNLKMVAASHNPNITIGNGIIYFEFLNINLPDSHTNNLMSNGYVKFKLKPINAVALGTQIPNKASIYFDYNSAVNTNIASTIIKVVTVPVKISSYEVKLKTDNNSTTNNNQTPNSKQVLNNWSVANEINVSHYNIQRSLTGSDFTTIGQVKAVNITNYNFTDNRLPSTVDSRPLTIYYRLMIVDKDGSIAYSTIKQITTKPQTPNIVIYPNPAQSIVNIECKDAKEIMVIDYLGKIVNNIKIINNQYSIINVQGYAKGVYLVKLLMNNGEIRTTKLIVE